MVDKDKINSTSVAILIFFLMKASCIGLMVYNVFQISKTSAYISVILGFIIGFIPILLIIYVMNKSEGRNILENNIFLFGKMWGNIINFLVTAVIFVFGTIIFYNLTTFIGTYYMPETPVLYIKILMIITIIYCLSKGIQSITRASQIMIFISIAVFLICVVGLLKQINLENLYPAFEDGAFDVFKGALMYSMLTSIPAFLITIIGKNQIVDSEKYSKKIIKMYIFTNIIIFTIIILTTLVLGFSLISVYRYPEYISLKKVVLLGIVERIENTLLLQLIFDSLILIIMSFHFVYKNFEYIKDNRIYKKALIYTIPILSLILSNVIFSNIIDATEKNMNYTPYILTGSILIVLMLNIIKININKFKKNKLNMVQLQE